VPCRTVSKRSRARDHIVHGRLHLFGSHRRLLDLTELLLDQHQELVNGVGHFPRGLPRFAAAPEHLLVVVTYMLRDVDHLADHGVQAVDEAVQPAPQLAAFIVRQVLHVDALAQITLALCKRADDVGQRLHACCQPARAEGGEHRGAGE